MIWPPFFIIFPGLFTQTQKISLDLGGRSKDLTKFFPKFLKKKLNKCPASRKHKGTFRHGKKTSKFFIIWFIFHDFSALNDFTNIFRFGGKIKVPTSQNLNFEYFKLTIKSKNFKRLEYEVYLSWFFNQTLSRKSFSILRRDQSPPSQTLRSENFENHKMSLIFHDFFSTMRFYKYFFDLAARSKCRQLEILILKILNRI